jgi:VIT1/CCC1 family predicted Fe2+/Mn2+ transporter
VTGNDIDLAAPAESIGTTNDRGTVSFGTGTSFAAPIVAGVAGASDSVEFILTAGVAGLVAGALSMAVGEYVSVSTQRDTERALLEKERRELIEEPEAELEELALIYEAKGLSKQTAKIVAQELTAHDAFAAHAEAELQINPNALINPMSAAYASAAAFVLGGIIPLLAIMFSPTELQTSITFTAVLTALIITGTLSARAGGANKIKATVRVVLGGILAMAITYGIGNIFGAIGI